MANLSQIINDLKAERDRLEKAIQALTSLDASSPRGGRRRTLSEAGRRRIAAAQKARWKRQRAVQRTPRSTRPKRRLSREGLARIRAAMRARWAEVKAGKKTK